MNKKSGIIILALLCIALALPFVNADTDLEINIHGEDPNVEVNTVSEGDGELVIVYNGENVLETIDGLKNANMVYMMTLKDERDIEKLIDIFEEQFYNFTIYVDQVTNTLYTRDNLLATNIGLTDVNNTLVLSIQQGETSVITEIELLKYQVETVSDIIKKNNEAILTDFQSLQAENKVLRARISTIENLNSVEVTKLNCQIDALEKKMERSAEENYKIFDIISSIVVMIVSVPVFLLTKSRL